jgi:uncharacterized protein (DUF983 family)
MSAKNSRPLLSALTRASVGRCPACGTGSLFRAFLKVNDQCPSCMEELHHHRADDFPAYLVMLIVGHVVVPAALYVEMHYAPSYWVHLALWLPLTLGLTIGLLQPIKGAVVGTQWHLGMHGFEYARIIRERHITKSVPLSAKERLMPECECANGVLLSGVSAV